MYSVKLGDFRLAIRKSIVIEDEKISVNLRNSSASDSACASGDGEGNCQSPVETTEITFTLRFIGFGDMNAAEVLYRRFEEYLADICNSATQTYQRRVQNEEFLELEIATAYMVRIDLDKEFDPCLSMKSGEVHLITATTDLTTQIASYGYTVTKPIN